MPSVGALLEEALGSELDPPAANRSSASSGTIEVSNPQHRGHDCIRHQQVHFDAAACDNTLEEKANVRRSVCALEDYCHCFCLFVKRKRLRAGVQRLDSSGGFNLYMCASSNTLGFLDPEARVRLFHQMQHG